MPRTRKKGTTSITFVGYLLTIWKKDSICRKEVQRQFRPYREELYLLISSEGRRARVWNKKGEKSLSCVEAGERKRPLYFLIRRQEITLFSSGDKGGEEKER